MPSLPSYLVDHRENRKSDITEREINLASSVQAVTEEIVLRMARYARELTQKENLCLSGGVALNCVANGKLLWNEKIFKEIWIQPASGDAGGCIGSSTVLPHFQLLWNNRALALSSRIR